MGVPFAMMVMVMYYQRLCVHKLPPREVVVSCFLPLGPLGMGGYTIMELGKVALHLFPQTGTLNPANLAGQIAYCVGFLLALIMWGFGLIWLGLALFTIHNAQPFPFNMGWWGFTFPLGVYSASTLQLGQEMPSRFFDVLGTIFSVSVILLWIVVTAGTIRGICKDQLFYAPCLAQLSDKHKYPKEDRVDGDKAA
jgi:tellurite resistance protein TehA-like permease